MSDYDYIFSSESVGEGHPDKVADAISDAVLDACLRYNPKSRVACETFVKSNVVVVGGEIDLNKDSGKAYKNFAEAVNIEGIVREAIKEIGYRTKTDDEVFNADTVFIQNLITPQSPDIAQGVDAKKAKGKKTAEQGAGDQGIMFGYATNETPELMPAPVMFAHKILQKLAQIRKAAQVALAKNPKAKPAGYWLRPDCKSQVAVAYKDGRPVHIENVVVSTQHQDCVEHAEIEKFVIEQVIREVVPAELLSKKTQYLINPTGTFIIGGPHGDTGLTGRKIIVDSYGGMGRHGGGAFSGKDASKVDRSAAYMCRWVAKNIVAAGLASRVELQVAYAIGHPHPTSIRVDTFGTGNFTEAEIEAAVKKVFSFKPADIIGQLDLLKPIYSKTTHYGHFTKADLPWEKLNKVAALKKAVGA